MTRLGLSDATAFGNAHLRGEPAAARFENGAMQRPKWLSIVLLTLLGTATTLYVNLSELPSLQFLRPVQLVPLVMGVCLLPTMHWSRMHGDLRYYAAPLLLTLYMAGRHCSHGPEGMLLGLRSVANLLGYWTMLLLLGRTRGTHGYTGLHLGCLISIGVAAAGVSLFDVTPRMGSGRWQGFMPGANRFANLCLISLVVALSLATARTKPSRWGFIQALIAGVGVLMSGSRACLALAVAGIACVFMLRAFSARKSPVSGMTVLTLAVISAGLAGIYHSMQDMVPPRIVEFVERIQNPREIFEEDSRSELHVIAQEYFLTNPAFGAGVDAERFELETARGDRVEISSHSTYWSLLSVSGLTGLILFAALPLLMLYDLGATLLCVRSRSPHPLAAEIVTSIAVLLIFGLHNSVISLSNSMHTWILFGACSHTAIRCRSFRLNHRWNRSVASYPAPRNLAGWRRPVPAGSSSVHGITSDH